jgi:hypothetical protein
MITSDGEERVWVTGWEGLNYTETPDEVLQQSSVPIVVQANKFLKGVTNAHYELKKDNG